MGRELVITLVSIAAFAAVVPLIKNFNSFSRYNRVVLIESKHETIKRHRRRVVEVLEAYNEKISKNLSIAANSYCNETLVEYPLPKYDACEENSTLNIIPFIGGMTNALKFIILGALMSFQEKRCFVVEEDKSPLSPDYNKNKNHNDSFLNQYFEKIGLPHDHPFVINAMAEGRFQKRYYQEYWGELALRRVERARYQYTTAAYSHPEKGVNGLALKRDFLRHMWHLQPFFRNTTCKSLKDHNIFDTNYIGLSIRRGDKVKERFHNFPDMEEYILEAESLIPSVFQKNQTPKLFVATDDCSVLDVLRQNRPKWDFSSECDKLSEAQAGFDLLDIPKLDKEKRDEHFGKFFVELYALALSKVFIGISYTNVAWFVYMMRPNVDKRTFIMLDYIHTYADPYRDW